MQSANGAPVVSILTIFRDAAPYVGEAIESAFAQSFRDWELLLVDDGSTDGTDDIAQRYVREHPDRVRYVRQPGGRGLGTGPARNLGFSHARGAYVAQLDADDVWGPDFLSRRVAALQAEPAAALAFGPVLRWYGWTGVGTDRLKDWVARPWDELGSSLLGAGQLLPMMLARAMEGGVPTGWVLRVSAVREVGDCPDGFVHMYEDQALLAKLSLGFPAVYLDSDPGDYLYRRHSASLVNVIYRNMDRRKIRLHFLEWLADYVQQHGAPADVRRELARQLRRCRHPRLMEAAEVASALPGRAARKAGRLIGIAANRANGVSGGGQS